MTLGRIAYAIFAGIITFLVILFVGLLIIHLVPAFADFGTTVKGLAGLLGLLWGLYVLFSGWTFPTRP